MINKLNVLNTYLKSNKTAIRYGIVCLTILVLGTIYCISVLAKKDKEAVEYYNYQTEIGRASCRERVFQRV